MNYSECLNAVSLVLESNEVPLIIGESGIGKTALVKYIARENGYNLVTIDANLLKEGEIGGQEGRYVEQRPLRVENVPNVVGSQDKYNTVPGNATTVWKTM